MLILLLALLRWPSGQALGMGVLLVIANLLIPTNHLMPVPALLVLSFFGSSPSSRSHCAWRLLEIFLQGE
jgi:hypothetical protein